MPFISCSENDSCDKVKQGPMATLLTLCALIIGAEKDFVPSLVSVNDDPGLDFGKNSQRPLFTLLSVGSPLLVL